MSANTQGGTRSVKEEIFKNRAEFSWRQITHPLSGTMQPDGNGGHYATVDLSSAAKNCFKDAASVAHHRKEYYKKLNELMTAGNTTEVAGSLADQQLLSGTDGE